MGQQPNIELSDTERPARKLVRAAEPRWTQSRPGEITTPSEAPSGGSFGRPGPDTGWGLTMIRKASFDRGSRPRALEKLLCALVGARASHARRGPALQDVEAALSLVGLHKGYQHKGYQHKGYQDYDRVPEEVDRCREKWLDALSHDPWPGRSALAAIPVDLLNDTPEQVRSRLLADPSLIG